MAAAQKYVARVDDGYTRCSGSKGKLQDVVNFRCAYVGTHVVPVRLGMVGVGDVSLELQGCHD